MLILKCIAAALIGYLLGCIPVGVTITRLYTHTDIRKTGSGNSGTTNVLRTVGWVPSLLTLAGDCLKGVLAAWLGSVLGGEAGMLLGGFAVLGHDFPVFNRFRGGKGIATSLGVTIIVCPPVAPCLLAIVIVIVALTRIMSIGSLTASVAYPVLFWLLLPEGVNMTLYMIFAVMMACLSAFCHRSNIGRLIRREENRLDFAKISRLSQKYKTFKKRK